MKNKSHNLYSNKQLGPFPMEKLRRVDKPTTLITDKVQQVDERESGFNRAFRGDYGPLVQKQMVRFVPKYPLSAALSSMATHLIATVDGKVSTSKAPIPHDQNILNTHIKRLGYFLRADIVGICELPRYAIYTHHKRIYDKEDQVQKVELNHKYAIVIVVDQDCETLEGSTGHDWISNSQSFRSYSATAFISCIMADYIRKLGYSARAHHARDYQVVLPPLLLLAGIGEMCRIGDVVLNPFLGVRFKAAVVTTDLPLLPDKPVDFGLQDFCKKCKKCAKECPSKAITMDDKVMYNGYEVWKPDIERCTKYRVTNQNGSGCGNCIKVCPWNKPEGWTHDAVRWMVQHTPFLNNTIVNLDDLYGYGKQNINHKWWFDLEDVDGILQIPDSQKK
jgi:3-chloro-4-hydroxyphenylacetate reductive dehalogenase